MIPWLPSAPPLFPATHNALKRPNGLLAAGGALTPDWLLTAYRQGIFPWFSEQEEILWWSPAPRMVLLPEQIHISKSLRKTLRRAPFKITFDQAFARVIQRCGDLREEDGTWILPIMQEAYVRLHHLGYAHSVECWQDGDLVGGLYGVNIGAQFFGESMFSTKADASKVALVALSAHCRQWGIKAIDCQMHTDHLSSMGAQLVERSVFEAMLNNCDQPNQASWLYCPECMYV